MPTVLRSVKLQWRVLLSENAHSVRIAGVYPARQVWQGVFLGTIPIVHQAPGVEVRGFCDLDMHVVSYRSCCKGIPAVVSANDRGIYMEILTAGQNTGLPSGLTREVGVSNLRALWSSFVKGSSSGIRPSC